MPRRTTSEPGSWTDTVRAAWDEDLPDDAETGLDSDDADDLAQQEENAPVVARIPSLDDRPTVVRNRYRGWAERLAGASAGLGPAERLLALRLVLWICAAGAWPGSDSGWLATVGKATEALGHSPDPPTDVEPATASLAAVALSVLRSRAPRSQRLEANRVFDRAAGAVSHLLPSLEPVYVEEYTKLLSDAFGPAAELGMVVEVVNEVVQHDPLADAVRALEDHDIWDAHVHGRVIHTTKAFGNPVLPAMQAVGFADSINQAVGAWAGTPDNWALVIWSKPDLVVFTHAKGARWIHYRLPGSYTPRLCAYGDKGIDRRFLYQESFGETTTSASVEACLETIGLTSPQPPQC